MDPPLFTIESFDEFLQGYVRNAGDLGRVELSRFPHATRQWVRQMRREQGLSDDDVVKTMCVGHANRLLLANDAPALLHHGASMTTVACVWMHALEYASFAEALHSCFAVFVAHAAERQGPAAAAKARDDALALASLAAELNTLDHGMARADALFAQAQASYFKGLAAIAGVAAADAPDDAEFAELARMSGEQLSEASGAGSRAFERATAVARRLVPETETMMQRSAEMFAEYNALMEELLEWRARAVAEARAWAPGVSRQMVCRAVLAAYDHLSHFDLQAWVALLDACSSDGSPKQQLLLRCIRETERGSVEERRAAPWRVSMHLDDASTVQRLVRESNAAARRRDAVISELVDAEAREARARQAPKKKAKRARRERRRADKALSRDLEGLSLDGGGGGSGGEDCAEHVERAEHVECVVCLDSPSSVRCEPCGHVVMCAACAAAWMRRSDQCPYCRCACACVDACA